MILETLIITSLGLALGSFATAMTARIPEGCSWITDKKEEGGDAATATRSACMSCGKILKFYNLIPVFSWLVQKGKCSQCDAKIGISYPLIELATALIAIGAYAAHGWTLETLWITAAAPFLVSLTAIDLKHYILPNQLVAILGGIGILRLLIQFQEAFLPYITGALVYSLGLFITGLILSRILKKESLGFGDVKLFAVCGLWLGLSNLPLFLILCGIFGVVLGFIWARINGKQIFPFAPAILLSFLVILLMQGHNIVFL